MQPLITTYKNQIIDLCKSHNVKNLYIFGSACTEKFTENSDIDFLVSFNEMEFGSYADTYFDLADQFETLLHRKVDLVTEKSLSNPYFIASVNQTKTLIYRQ